MSKLECSFRVPHIRPSNLTSLRDAVARSLSLSIDDIVFVDAPAQLLHPEQIELVVPDSSAEEDLEAKVAAALAPWVGMDTQAPPGAAVAAVPTLVSAQARSAVVHPAWPRFESCATAAVRRYLRIATEAHTRAVAPDAAKSLLMDELHASGVSLDTILDEVNAQAASLRRDIAARSEQSDEAATLRRRIADERRRREALEGLTSRTLQTVEELARECAGDGFDVDTGRLSAAVVRARAKSADLSKRCASLATAKADHDSGETKRGVALQAELARVRELLDSAQARYVSLGGADLARIDDLNAVADRGADEEPRAGTTG